MATKLRKGDRTVTAHKPSTVTRLKAHGYTEVKAPARSAAPTPKPESKDDAK